MRRKLSAVLAMVMVLNLVAAFATLLPVTTVIAEEVVKIPLVEDTFESYSTAAEMQAVWTGNVGTVTRSWQNGGPAGSTKMLRASGFSASNYAKAEFTQPVVLTAAGGTSPGKNAKLVTEYYVNGANYTSGNSCYWGITNSTMGNSNSIKYAVGVATRGGDAGAALRYNSYIGSAGALGDILLAGVGGDQSGGWHKVKFIINITDENGDFLSGGPTVEAYIDDGTTNILPQDKPLMNTGIAYVDEFRVSGSHASRYADTDNVNIYLEFETDGTIPPPPPTDKSELIALIAVARDLLSTAFEGDLEGQYTTAKIAALSAAIDIAQAVVDDPDATQTDINIAKYNLQNAIDAFTPNTPTPKPVPTIAPDGTLYSEDFEDAANINDVANVRNISSAVFSIIDNGTRKYLKMSKGAAPYDSGPQFDLLFNPVKVKAGTAPAGTENLIIPDENTVLVAQFDVRAISDATSNRTAHLSVSGRSSSGSVQNLAMMYHYGKSGDAYYTYGKPAAAGTPSIPSGFADKYIINPVTSGGWYTVKMVIPITDPTGAFVGGDNNVSIYVDDELTAVENAPFINSGSVIADRISLKECNFYAGTLSDGSQGFCIDNISVKLETVEPTATPEPTPEPAPVIGIVYSEDFEEYTDSADVRANSGWGGTVSFETNVTLGEDSGNKYLSVLPNQTAAFVTFDPIPLKAGVGVSPGADAKLVATYRIARKYTTTGWNAFAFVDRDVSQASSNNFINAALVAGHRPETDADEGQWLYRSSFTSNIAPGNANEIKGGIYSESAGQWTTVKYVVSLTDGNGDYITPKVDIYVDGSPAPVLSDVSLLNYVDKIDKLLINCVSSTTKTYYIDDIEVKVILGDEPVPTIEPPLTPTPVPYYIMSSDETITVDQETKKITYPHYKIGTVNYHYLATIKSKLTAVSGYTYEVVQSDGVTEASGTYTEPMHKVIVSYGGTPVATYTFIGKIQYGDINGDGAITASDLGLLKRYLMSKTTYAFVKPYGLKAADINKQGSGSNTVTTSDLGLLKRYIMSKTLYPISAPTEFLYDPTAV